MYDLLLSRYHSMDFILQMDLIEGLELYRKAREKRNDERLYQAWVSLYPHFSKENFISWEDYKNRHSQVKVPTVKKSAAELIAEAADIKKQIEGR
jgi:hypothetical protein